MADKSNKNEYATRGLNQIPRLLSLQDRNPYSKTYGCFTRQYWLDTTADFPTALAQFGTQALALAYANKMPGNIYYKQEKIKNWTIAGIEYWISLQHSDGSFDEFYPNERGWAGPTGFLLYAMFSSYQALGEEFPPKLKTNFIKTCHKAGIFLAKYDEYGVLFNHHAMALLPIFAAYRLTNDNYLLIQYEKKFAEFKSYFSSEGWGLEYDGPDLGYLSATVSFLAKLHKLNPPNKKEIENMCKQMIEFSSYFVYPNGFYAGTMGSRNTLHFYPHGYEYFAKQFPLASKIAKVLLNSLKNDKLVAPEIQADRYFLYRIPEFLESYLESKTRKRNLPKLAYEKRSFSKYFPEAQIQIKNTSYYYLVINAKKGGMAKVFNKTGELIENDCGILLKNEQGQILTSQWNNPEYKIKQNKQQLIISGNLTFSKQKVFTPLKFILFRLFVICFAWQTQLAYWTKGLIRMLLMLGNKKTSVSFSRQFNFTNKNIQIIDIIANPEKIKFAQGLIGDEIPVRYVPQSRYFQNQELKTTAYVLSQKQLNQLNLKGKLKIVRKINI
ncbi:MAG: hypothetical protein ABFQ62_05265 [Patescibacteria group bacterium]